ncbi:RNA 2',3'-cyclic phosphodiesterase [Methanohalophilus sp.]|uniref:RNA 2',3'-cyclic phosphodiesterase n=1 Tax=Methanohalophilus sp. TaxID=1966352 RepID=UPI0026198375|nr:RNA 2',3'-cyclic phosphodiesterase [Methanohalophilus sp.]MDK2892571.1 2,3-cyclic 3-phosphodiesterase [Methanohalophilus sp.]
MFIKHTAILKKGRLLDIVSVPFGNKEVIILIRTFVAVDIPEKLKKGFEDILSDLNAIKGIKVVHPSNIHVTLKFLGDVKTSRIPDVIERLDEVKASPFMCRIEMVGVFPSSSRPRIIWLGLGGQFDNLHLQVEHALDGMGFKKDKHEYISHATIGRVKFLKGEQKEKLKNFLQEYGDKYFGEFEVTSFKLKKSTLTPEGPIYETLHEFSLQ